MRGVAALLPLALVAGCIGAAGGTSADPLRPPGLAAGVEAVDPALVGDRLLAAGEGGLALESYVRAAAGPGGLTPGLRHAMARAHMTEGRLRRAEALLREAIAAEPRNAGARNDLGVALLELGRPVEAQAMLRSAYALEPRPETRENLRLSAAALTAGLPGAARDGAVLIRRGNGAIGLETGKAAPSPAPPADGGDAAT